jgi:hypothetical protein
MIILEKEIKEDMEEIIVKAGGRHNQGERSDLHCDHCGKNESHEENTCIISWEKIKYKHN